MNVSDVRSTLSLAKQPSVNYFLYARHDDSGKNSALSLLGGYFDIFTAVYHRPLTLRGQRSGRINDGAGTELASSWPT